MRKYEVEVRRIFARLPKGKQADLPATAKRYCAAFHEFVKACAEGRENVHSRYSREAGERLCRVFDNVPPIQMLTRVSALYLMKSQEPRLFRDERAFRFQLVRGFRKLTSVADGSYWRQRDQRVKQIVNPIPARVQELMGEWVTEFATPFVLEVTRCAALIEKTDNVKRYLAADTFAPLRDKLQAEHARLERKLHTARRIHAEQNPHI